MLTFTKAVIKLMIIAEILQEVLHIIEPPHDKTNKMTVHPAKTQISLGIWSESMLCASWVAKDPSFLHADSEDWSDWADAQVELSLRWAHMPFCLFWHEAAHMDFSASHVGKFKVFQHNQRFSNLWYFHLVMTVAFYSYFTLGLQEFV